jgi:hypothetical protein
MSALFQIIITQLQVPTSTAAAGTIRHSMADVFLGLARTVHTYTPYMTVYWVISLPIELYIHRIYIYLWPTLRISILIANLGAIGHSVAEVVAREEQYMTERKGLRIHPADRVAGW